MANLFKQSTKRVWELRLQGYSNLEIKDILDLTPCAIASAVRRGRECGALPRYNQTAMPDRRRGSEIRRGTISLILSGLSIEQQEWLVHEAADTGCETIAEYILEIVRDEYEQVKSK